MFFEEELTEKIIGPAIEVHRHFHEAQLLTYRNSFATNPKGRCRSTNPKGTRRSAKARRHKGIGMKFEPVSDREEEIAGKIVDAAYAAHKALGPGLKRMIL